MHYTWEVIYKCIVILQKSNPQKQYKTLNTGIQYKRTLTIIVCYWEKNENDCKKIKHIK